MALQQTQTVARTRPRILYYLRVNSTCVHPRQARSGNIVAITSYTHQELGNHSLT